MLLYTPGFLLINPVYQILSASYKHCTDHASNPIIFSMCYGVVKRRQHSKHFDTKR